MIKITLLAIVAALTSCLACAPVNPSHDAVVGHWNVEWTCGVEALELKPDGTYVYAVDFAEGGRATDSGRWRIEAKTERLVGAHVILQSALQPCSVFGQKAVQPQRGDRKFETIWEWGRMILSFNPDIQGFTRGWAIDGLHKPEVEPPPETKAEAVSRPIRPTQRVAWIAKSLKRLETIE